jgi:GntR family transcriptional regulator
MGEPMYRMIAEDLRGKIDSGEIPAEPGGTLPTEKEMQADYGASRNTVRDAIKFLTQLGLIETRPGQGTFVVEKPIPFVTTLTGDPASLDRADKEAVMEGEGRSATSSDPKVEIQHATAVVAADLDLTEGAQVVSRQQNLFMDGTPWSMQTTYYPMSFVEQGATLLLQPTDIEEGAINYLAREYDVQQVGYRDTISVRPPDVDEAWFFKLPPDGRISVLEIHRVGFDGSGSPMRLTVTVYPADRNQLRVEVGKVPVDQPVTSHPPTG